MESRTIAVCRPVADVPWLPDPREWTEITLEPDELMMLLGMPPGTRLISIGSCAMTGVRITVEEPLEA